jgi:hypothetical protein
MTSIQRGTNLKLAENPGLITLRGSLWLKGGTLTSNCHALRVVLVLPKYLIQLHPTQQLGTKSTSAIYLAREGKVR